MKCDDIAEKLSSYVDGELGGDEGRPLEEHLAACAGCRDLARRLRIVGAGVEKIEGVVPRDFRETLFARLEKEGLLPRRRSLFAYSIRWAAVPLAAAAGLALFVLTSRETGIKAPGPVAQRPPATAEEQASPAQEERERPSVARQASEAPVPTPGTGAGGRLAADSRVGEDLTPEEREIVANLEVLEDPAAMDEPSEIDELDFVEPAGRSRG